MALVARDEKIRAGRRCAFEETVIWFVGGVRQGPVWVDQMAGHADIGECLVRHESRSAVGRGLRGEFRKPRPSGCDEILVGVRVSVEAPAPVGGLG